MKQLSAFWMMGTLFAMIMFANRTACATGHTIEPNVATVDCLEPYINQTDDSAPVQYIARWNANQYTVKFNPNATTGVEGNMPDKTYTYDETGKTLPLNAFVRQDHDFIGWCKGHDYCAVDERIADGAAVLNWSTTQGAEIELFAQWRPSCVAHMHIGNDKLCLYKSKISASNMPSFAIRIENNVYYTAMSPIGDNSKTISDESNTKLHIKYGTKTYNVHDYSMME